MSFDHLKNKLGAGFTAALTVACLIAATPVSAQTWPDKSITLIAPFPPGGTTDILARAVAQNLQAELGQTVVVQNRPGAGGTLGTAIAARAAADGYTLLLSNVGNTAAGMLYADLSFNFDSDFTHITTVAVVPNVLIVTKSSPYDTLDQLLADTKKRPGQVNFGSAGVGTPQHLNAELLALKPTQAAQFIIVNNAIEIDVDCLCDGQEVFIGGVMEHIEQAGVHSGDSACSLPPYSLSPEMTAEIKRQTALMARALNVKGLMNVQFAVQNGDVYVLEVNPRASRTVPFVSKATGLQLAKIAARAMAGQTLASQGVTKEVVPHYFSVKEAVFPFVKFPGVDTILGPEMKSTGEVMGVGVTFGEAFVKSQMAASVNLPVSGTAFISVKNQDKPKAVEVARGLHALGFKVVATRGTSAAIEQAGIPVSIVNKVAEGRPHIVYMLKNGEISLVINTVEERRNAITDSRAIRTQALAARVTYYTTIAGAWAAVEGMQYLREGLGIKVYSLQDLHQSLKH